MTPEQQELQNEFNNLYEEYLKNTERTQELKNRMSEIMEILDPDIFEASTEEIRQQSENLSKEIKLKKFANSLR